MARRRQLHVKKNCGLHKHRCATRTQKPPLVRLHETMPDTRGSVTWRFTIRVTVFLQASHHSSFAAIVRLQDTGVQVHELLGCTETLTQRGSSSKRQSLYSPIDHAAPLEDNQHSETDTSRSVSCVSKNSMNLTIEAL